MKYGFWGQEGLDKKVFYVYHLLILFCCFVLGGTLYALNLKNYDMLSFGSLPSTTLLGGISLIFLGSLLSLSYFLVRQKRKIFFRFFMILTFGGMFFAVPGTLMMYVVCLVLRS
ncbi:MAG: hypothetical protein LiPW41_3 [Parcubacteria group bacterium LiPW_41]|nr:MAG: hypothetical protein LiPW41_3 [Parcubacteria group bacterium LiPW_41]